MRCFMKGLQYIALPSGDFFSLKCHDLERIKTYSKSFFKKYIVFVIEFINCYAIQLQLSLFKVLSLGK